jgi:hypothetical protein
MPIQHIGFSTTDCPLIRLREEQKISLIETISVEVLGAAEHLQQKQDFNYRNRYRRAVRAMAAGACRGLNFLSH